MSQPMRSYAVYGASLSSSVAFPELHEIPATQPRWTFDTAPRLAPMVEPVELGSDLLYSDVRARLFAHAAGHRIMVDDTGSFELSLDRRLVTWEERAESWPDFVRAHLLGRVLATALYLDGLLPLHGSAVETREGVIAFLAPKGFGKSTLALALTAAGARLVSDDSLPVEAAAAPRAWPGVHSIRVHDDVVSTLGVGRRTLETSEGKRVITAFDDDRLLSRPAPLATIYLLDPLGGEDAATTRTAAPAMLAAIGIVAHVKIGRMLGRSAAAPMLERAAAIAHAVPVYRLHRPRDLAQLAATTATLLEWHGIPSA